MSRPAPVDPPRQLTAAMPHRVPLAERAQRAVSSVASLVGRTPLVRLRRLEPRVGIEIWGKCEFHNPGGSVKDRAAYFMIEDALARGVLTAGKTLIDATSGNTGVAYSMLGAALGIDVTLVMPANVSAARKNISAAYGTRLIFSSELEGSDGAIRLARQLVAESPGRYFYPDQYGNEANPLAHSQTTAPEILDVVGDRITHFIAGIGTSGTVMGCGRRLHAHRADIRVLAVQPDDALHGLEGLKHMPTSIRPPIWRPEEAVDEVIDMSTDEAWDMAERVTRLEGLFLGHSAGAAMATAVRVAATIEPEHTACIVCILPDRGDRYFAPLSWARG